MSISGRLTPPITQGVRNLHFLGCLSQLRDLYPTTRLGSINIVGGPKNTGNKKSYPNAIVFHSFFCDSKVPKWGPVRFHNFFRVAVSMRQRQQKKSPPSCQIIYYHSHVCETVLPSGRRQENANPKTNQISSTRVFLGLFLKRIPGLETHDAHDHSYRV